MILRFGLHPIRRKKVAVNRDRSGRQLIRARFVRPAISEPSWQSSKGTDIDGNLIPSAMLEEDTKPSDTQDLEDLDTSPADPLQFQFDLLTKGLLDGL